MEEVEVWLARDKNDKLFIYTHKPRRAYEYWQSGGGSQISNMIEIDKFNFPNIKWEDKEPTKAKITLIK